MRRTYLIRHAKAGDRDRYEGDDASRPLTDKGHGQAAALGELLMSSETPPAVLLSSPALRCHSTLAPLGASAGLEVEIAEWLNEGSDAAGAMGEIGRLGEDVVAACTHGDVIWGMLEWLARKGVVLGERPDAPKGSIWVLDWPDSPAARVPLLARFVAPPVP